ncbi:odorant receptor 67d-like [Drosophila tropicalis]|uniref:odorant receptor 67d-like n=1 Tax=Drosophila tropicalis TaxID=46794 RepID=UPI0035ABD338
MIESPAKRFCKIIKLIRFCVGFCGTDVANPNYRMWWLTYAVISAILFFFACTIYTLYVGVVVDGDPTVILQAFAMVGSAIQGLTKLLCTTNKAPLMRDIQGTYESIYKEYEVKGGDYTKCLHKRINIYWNLMVGFMWVYTIGVVVLVSFPFFYLIVYKKKMLVMQFLVPGIDHHSDGGHLMLVSLHVTCLCFGAFGNFGGDMYFFLFIINVPLLKDIFNVKLMDFNEVVVQRTEYDKMHAMLWDLLSWHQQYVRILRGTEKIYKIVMFVQLSTTCVGILCTIFCIFIKVWPAAPIYLIYSFIVLYTFCGLGTVVETSNEDFTTEIYTNCLWYELPVREQKLVILMLAKSQNELALTAADVLPLSMATALQLTKGIYSFSMMLITYLGYEKSA